MVKCQDYSADVTSGKYSIDLKTFFASQLSTIDRVLMVTHPKREYKLIPDLSKQSNKTVAFEQTFKIDSNSSELNYRFKNFQRIDGRICILAQGNGL